MALRSTVILGYDCASSNSMLDMGHYIRMTLFMENMRQERATSSQGVSHRKLSFCLHKGSPNINTWVRATCFPCKLLDFVDVFAIDVHFLKRA